MFTFVTVHSMGCGVSKVVSQVESPFEPVAQDRKLNVLVLHGTTMCGDSMKGMFRWKECGIELASQDIANF